MVQAHANGLWPADIQPYSAVVCRLVVSISVIHGLLPIFRPWMDGRLSWPGWLTHGRQFNHKVSTIDQDKASVEESPPAKDRRQAWYMSVLCVGVCMQFLNISDAVTSTPSRGVLDDRVLSVLLDTPAVCKTTTRYNFLLTTTEFVLIPNQLVSRLVCNDSAI